MSVNCTNRPTLRGEKKSKFTMSSIYTKWHAKPDLVAISLLLEHKINDAINLKILKW